jgi:hypothetical protein
MFIIPITKTSCGEVISGRFSCENDVLVSITLDLQGSRLLEEVSKTFIMIVEKRKLLYVKKAKDIFWRINKIPFTGSRKDTVNEILSFLSNYILDSVLA